MFTEGREGFAVVVLVPLLDGIGAGVPVMPMISGAVEEDSDEEVRVEFRAADRLDERNEEEVSTAGVICVTRLLGTGGIEVMRDCCAEVC